MKISWGYKITFLYIGFAGLILFLVTKSLSEKVDLVTPDYYAKELVYQNKKESIERNNRLEHPAEVFWNKDGIKIEFPVEFDNNLISGTVNIFRPSDQNLDLDVEIKPDAQNIQYISNEKLKTGMYRINVEYFYNNSSYFVEKQIVVRSN